MSLKKYILLPFLFLFLMNSGDSLCAALPSPKDGFTETVKKEDVDLLEKFITQVGNVDQGAEDGSTALHVAAYNGHASCVALIAQDTNLNQGSNNGCTASQETIFNSHSVPPSWDNIPPLLSSPTPPHCTRYMPNFYNAPITMLSEYTPEAQRVNTAPRVTTLPNNPQPPTTQESFFPPLLCQPPFTQNAFLPTPPFLSLNSYAPSSLPPHRLTPSTTFPILPRTSQTNDVANSQNFPQENTISVPYATRTRERPYQCSFCDKSFKQKSNLTEHERIHTGDKPYQCSFCHKKFKNKSDLTRHEHIHTGDKPFECAVCSKKFNRKSNLAQHERIHTGDKPFACAVCNKKFNQKSNLTTHERMHTGDKPFECAVCNKKFNQKGSLTRHERIHTQDKPFACTVCDKEFRHKSNLTRHERTQHLQPATHT
jgi:uncharacterized Zn-finger protein